jgi:hypothetical protein
MRQIATEGEANATACPPVAHKEKIMPGILLRLWAVLRLTHLYGARRAYWLFAAFQGDKGS